MGTIGIAVIGQGPRPDIEAIFAEALPPGTRILLRGCLDGLTDDEIEGLAPRDGDDTLYTRLRAERDAKISKEAVIARAPATLSALRGAGADTILFACTGAFPAMPGDVGVVFPSRILSALAQGLLPRGRLGLLVPAAEQIAKLSRKWERAGVEICARALLPSATLSETEAAARELAERQPDLVAMDCMSYRSDMKAVVRETTRTPTILAVSATARVLQELLA
jgi:protein AroM